MKRPAYLTILAMVILSLALLAGACRAEISAKVYINGVRQNVNILNENGTAYLPAGETALALGIKVEWNPQTRIVKINDQVVLAYPLIVKDRLYLTVEAMTKASGASVIWDGANNALFITKNKENSAQNTEEQTSEIKIEPLEKGAGNTMTAAKSTPTPESTPPRIEPISQVKSVQITAPPADSPQAKILNYVPYGQVNSSAKKSEVDLPKTESYQYRGEMDTEKNEYPFLMGGGSTQRLPSNLAMPPVNYGRNQKNSYQEPAPYIPRSGANGIFKVAVSNMEYATSLKDYYKPKPGYRYVLVYLSQQNISNESQVYSGRFTLVDDNNISYEYIDRLSNFWLVILRPGGSNFGYLVFEIPVTARPARINLQGANMPPLLLGL